MRKINKYLNYLLIAALNCMKLDVEDPVCKTTREQLDKTNMRDTFQLLNEVNAKIVSIMNAFYQKLNPPCMHLDQKMMDFLEELSDYLVNELQDNLALEVDYRLKVKAHQEHIDRLKRRFDHRRIQIPPKPVFEIHDNHKKDMKRLLTDVASTTITKQDFIKQALDMFANPHYKNAISGTILSTLHRLATEFPRNDMICIKLCMPDFIHQFRSAEDKNAVLQGLLNDFENVVPICIIGKALDHLENSLGIEDKDTFVKFVQEKRASIDSINPEIIPEFNAYKANPYNLVIMSDDVKKLLIANKHCSNSSKGFKVHQEKIMNAIMSNPTILAAFVHFCQMHEDELAPAFEKLNNLLATIE